ncbi:MAG TPA: ABC transporter permease, partial [Ilumatobacteraceae bacterium]|nr:ABC transporter permease [Ilumatobacteraceae bacterium]
LLPALGLVAVQLVFFGMPAGAWVRGVVLGLLIALLAMGMALVYRANRVINFAQADLGFVPTSLAVGLIVFSGLPYLFGFGVGLAAAIALGAIVELAFVRRFAKASRLVLTVATIGITQLLAVLALLVPRMWDQSAASPRIPPPVDWKLTIGTFILSANDLIAMIVAPLAMVAVAIFLGATRLGTAIRGSAERSERALMLGIPVAWLSTLVWAIAAGLSFLALFLRAGILGVPLGAALNLSTLVLALAALVIGRLRHLPTVATAAVALGILEYGVAWNASSPLLVTPIIGAAVLIALLLQRRQYGRADRDEAAAWRLADEVRPLEPWVARVPLVRLLRWGTATLIVVGLVLIPLMLRTDQIIKATAVAVFAVIGLSLVVLSGWAGQISLGQMAFVAIGAAVSGKCTITWNVDMSLALLLGGAAGAVAALVVGLPALRLRGLYLAVTTLVFALAVNSWLLNRQFFDWVPQERIERLPLFGRIDVSTPTRFYVYTLVVLALVYVALRGVRHSRTGRAIVALRENELAAQAFSVSPVPVKLTAFIISGFVAGVAGGLFVHLSQSFDLTSYGAAASLDVFTAAVVGGLGSLFGGVLGAVFLRGSEWFITAPEWRLLSSALGVLFVLLILPGGLASLVIKVRDWYVSLVLPDPVLSDPTPKDTKDSSPAELDARQAASVDTELLDTTPDDLEPAERSTT